MCLLKMFWPPHSPLQDGTTINNTRFDLVTQFYDTVHVIPFTCSGSAVGWVVLRPVTSLTRRLI